MPKNNNANQTAPVLMAAANLSLIEKKWEELNRLNTDRNKFAQVYVEEIHKLQRHYQPFCLKDYFLYLNNKKKLDLLSLLDKQLSKMEDILQKAEEGWEQRFDVEKVLFKNHSVDANSFLRKLGDSKIDNQGVEYFKITEYFEKYLEDKKKYIGYDHARQEIDKFIKTIDKYWRYFNLQNVMPETIGIRCLINEIKERSQLEYDPDPGQLIFLQRQLEEKVSLLEKSMNDARRQCEAEHQSLQNVMLSLSPPPVPTEGLFSKKATTAQRGHCPYGDDDEDGFVVINFNDYRDSASH